ncbi:hypothetical protein MJH12_03225, partial [bacterium]|nr:hypothetical protein [bacterium]
IVGTDQHFDNGQLTETVQLIRKKHFQFFDDENENSNSMFELPLGIEMSRFIYHPLVKKIFAFTHSGESSTLNSFDFQSKSKVSLSTSEFVFTQNFPSASSNMTSLLSGSTNLSDFDTLAYAVSNKINFDQISFPKEQYLRLKKGNNASELYVLLRSVDVAKLYLLHLDNKEVELVVDFTQTFSSPEGNIQLQADEVHIAKLGINQSVILQNGSVYHLDMNDLSMTAIYVNKSHDPINAVVFPQKSFDLNIKEIAYSQADPSNPYFLFHYPGTPDLKLAGISKGLPVTSNIILSFVRGQEQFVAIENAFDFDQKTIRDLSQESWDILDDQQRSQLAGIPNFVAIALQNVKLKNAIDGVYLYSRSLLNSQLIALDPRPITSSDLVISNLVSASGNLNVAANEVLTFDYLTSNNQAIELYGTIGSELLRYDNGSASIKMEHFVNSFQNKVLAGSVGVDILGRKTKVYPGLDTSLVYTQSLLDFVPETSAITIETDIIEPLNYSTNIEFSIKSTLFTTTAIIILRSNGSIVEVQEFSFYENNGMSETRVYLNLPSGVDQIV